MVDARDARFVDLSVWRDANGNHRTDAGELMTLADAGVVSLAVDYTELPFLDAQGNLHLERSSATKSDGAVVDMTDVYLNVSAFDAEAAGVSLPNLAELLGSGGDAIDNLWLDGEVDGPEVAATDVVDSAPGDYSIDSGAASNDDLYVQPQYASCDVL